MLRDIILGYRDLDLMLDLTCWSRRLLTAWALYWGLWEARARLAAEAWSGAYPNAPFPAPWHVAFAVVDGAIRAGGRILDLVIATS